MRCVQSIWPRRYDLPISRLLGRRNRLAEHPAYVSNAIHDKRLLFEVTCSLNDLRIDGTLREFADWQQVQDSCALDGTQIMELKRASLLFKRNPPPKIVLPEFLCRLSQCIALRNGETSYLS